MSKYYREPRAVPLDRALLAQEALDEITNNYREASLTRIAQEHDVSLSYVSECVRMQTGKSYKQLLQSYRLETAAHLLRRSSWSIQRIISHVGYENSSYFYRLFHEQYGMSPREYRLARRRKTA